MWAAILGTFFYPAHRRLQRRVGRPNLAALLSTTAVAVLLIAPLSWLGWSFVTEAVEAIRNLDRAEIAARLQTGLDFVSARVPDSFGNVEDRIGEWAQAATEKTAWPDCAPAGEHCRIHPRFYRLAAHAVLPFPRRPQTFASVARRLAVRRRPPRHHGQADHRHDLGNDHQRFRRGVRPRSMLGGLSFKLVSLGSPGAVGRHDGAGLVRTGVGRLDGLAAGGRSGCYWAGRLDAA